MPKKGNILLPVILLLVIVGVGYLLISQNVVQNPLAPTPQKVEVELQTEYKNPFAKSSEYKNPFAGYKNPFDNFK